MYCKSIEEIDVVLGRNGTKYFFEEKCWNRSYELKILIVGV